MAIMYDYKTFLLQNQGLSDKIIIYWQFYNKFEIYPAE